MEEVALAALCPARVRRSIRPHPAARVRAPRISAPRAAGHVRVAARRIGETTYALFASSSEESQRHSSLTCLRISGFETNYASRAPDFLRDLKQLSEEKGRRGRQPFRIAVRHGAVALGPALRPRLGEPVAHTERGVVVGAVRAKPRAREHHELEAEAEGRRADANAAAGDRGARGAGVPGGARARRAPPVSPHAAHTLDSASQPDPNTKITVPMQFAGQLDDSKFIIIWRVERV